MKRLNKKLELNHLSLL